MTTLDEEATEDLMARIASFAANNRDRLNEGGFRAEIPLASGLVRVAIDYTLTRDTTRQPAGS